MEERFDICGKIRFDEDDDGIAESTSTLADIITSEITLTGPIIGNNIGSADVVTIQREADGSYCFKDLIPGAYVVSLTFLGAMSEDDFFFYSNAYGQVSFSFW